MVELGWSTAAVKAALHKPTRRAVRRLDPTARQVGSGTTRADLSVIKA